MPQRNDRRPRRNNPRQQRNDRIDVENNFNREWISSGITKETVEFTKKFGKQLSDGQTGISTSQIRNIYGELKRIELKGFNNEKTSFLLLKPKVAYAAKRHKSDGMINFKKVFDEAYNIIDDEKSFLNFIQIMEATLAYHKSFGGK